jgi:hypothetical protein
MSSVETDPFQMLNLSPTANKMEIKRAYKRMALKYHPDVATNRDTPTDERKRANEAFAKINWAYAQLSGRYGDTGSRSSPSSRSSSTTTTSSTSTSTRSSSRAPPQNRRTTTTTTSSTSSSSYFYSYNPDQPIWADIMPNYRRQYETYNAGGTSFDKKLEDAFNAAADGAEGGGVGDMFRDCVEFLENNIFGCSSPGEEECDVELHTLLTTGSVEQVGVKMDETELVVQQLEEERSNLTNELHQANHRIAHTKFYLEKKELEKKVVGLEARASFLDGDLEKAREFLLALKTRHEQLGGRSDSSSRSTSLGAASSKATSGDGGTASSAWKNEGYGNIGRGPGSSRRSRGNETQSTAGSSPAQTSSPSTSPLPRQESSAPPSPWRQTSTTRPQSSTRTKETRRNGSTAPYSSAPDPEDAWIHAEFGSFYTGRGRGTDSQSTADSSEQQSSPSSSSPPTRLENPVPPPPRRQTSTARPQSSTTTTTTGTSSDGGTASSSTEEDAWKHEGYGNIGRGPGSSRRSQGRVTRSASSGQQQKFKSADPSAPSRKEKKDAKSKTREARKATSRTEQERNWMEKLAGVFNARPKSK